jgi:uncharacterized protein YkwD
MARIALLAALVVVVLLVPQVAPATPQGRAERRVVTLETLLLREVNSVRRSHGLRPLKTSPRLERAALAHARSMLTLGYFAHQSFDGTSFSARVKRYYPARNKGWTVGENLAMFGGVTPSARQVVKAWLASPSHRANLLRPFFREAGFAVLQHPSPGGIFEGAPTVLVTLDLGRR